VILKTPEADGSWTLPDGTVVETDAELAIWEVGGDVALIARGTELVVDAAVKIEGGDAEAVTRR